MSETENDQGKKPAEPVSEDSQTSRPEGEQYHSRILIKPNGEVVIENLSIDLMELLEMLDPDAEVACAIPEGPASGSQPEEPAGEGAKDS